MKVVIHNNLPRRKTRDAAKFLVRLERVDGEHTKTLREEHLEADSKEAAVAMAEKKNPGFKSTSARAA